MSCSPLGAIEPAALDFADPAAPRSVRYGDTYFSAQDGLAETRAVYLAGCGLPQAWAVRRRFTVAELGFGTGLNLLALLDLWRRTAPPSARLSVFSVEAHPVNRADAARAHAAFPELAEPSAALLAAWPTATRGVQRIALPAYRATLDVAVMDVVPALAGWSGAADAWFLDGFAPALNPAMWTAEVLARVAALTAPGGRLASFTVAGHVRRHLAAAGLDVAKRPGFGRKRERLEAVKLGAALPERAPPRVAVMGAGIAGAALAQALAGEGLAVTIHAPPEPPAASDAPAARVAPWLDSGGGAAAQLSAQAFARAVQLYRDVDGAVLAHGSAQLEADPRDAARFDRLARSELFAPGTLQRLTPDATATPLEQRWSNTAALLEHRCSATAPAEHDVNAPGLWLEEALTIRPQVVRAAWLAGAARRTAAVAAVVGRGGGWALLDAAGAVLDEAEVVCLAGGWDGAALRPQLPLTPVRGQLTTAVLAGAERPVATGWGGYLLPTDAGLLCGATHQRGRADVAPDPVDDAANLARLAAMLPEWAERARAGALAGHAAVRAATPDRQPLAGRLAPGLFCLTGLGGRGFTTAPLLAEHVAALIAGSPSPLPADLAAVVDPGRFG